MKSHRRAQTLALIGAIGAFLVAILLLKLRSWMPFAVGFVAYIVLVSMLWPRRKAVLQPPPVDETPATAEDEVLAGLDAAARQLRVEAAEAPPADAPLIQHMAELVERIRAHHEANPEHARPTRVFRRHALPAMVEAVTEYVALTRRAGPDQTDRLRDISRELEGFVPILEKIDRGCLENDLDALEINIEVLGDQVRRND